MCAYLHAKSEVFSIILTSLKGEEGGGGGGEERKSPAPENELLKKPTEIRVKIFIKMVKMFTVTTLASFAKMVRVFVVKDVLDYRINMFFFTF